MAQFHKASSPYKHTKVVDYYLDLWAIRNLEPRTDDLYVQITPQYHLRPDKLAYDLYGTPNLFWIFFVRNKDILLDPIEDFKAGTKMYVPSKAFITTNFL